MSTPLPLPEEFTIYTLAGLRREWLSKLPKLSRNRRGVARASAPWLLDGSAVVETDAAALQLLVAVAHALAARNRKLVIIRPSDRLLASCKLLGLAPLLLDGGEQGVAA